MDNPTNTSTPEQDMERPKGADLPAGGNRYGRGRACDLCINALANYFNDDKVVESVIKYVTCYHKTNKQINK